MKYQIAVIALVILCALVMGDGYLKSRHARQAVMTLKASVAAMSIQELARSSQECDSPPRTGQPVKHDAAYCAEVWRVIEDQPLQAVEVTRSPVTPSVR
jgi:hypothetical protein